MTFTATLIANIINGSIEGNANATVESFGKIEEATSGQLAFLANPKYEEHLYTTKANIIIINATQELKQPIAATLIRVHDAYTAFATLLDAYQKIQTQQLVGIEQPSFIHPTASIANEVYVGAFSYIAKNASVGSGTKIFQQVYIGENVSIGSGTILMPGVKIYNDCKLGNNITVHANTVIGGDGFGFAPQADGTFKKVPQIGNVLIEDGVEIGSNSCIDRATIGSTIIKAGAKIDNLVQIAHNVEVGSNTVIAAQSGISGSTKLGRNVMIGGQAGIVGHLQLGDGAKVNAQSGVSKSIPAGKVVTGSPAFDYTAALRSQAAARKLPDMEKRIKELETILATLLEEKK
jgi:UDP-3-O-[3-hydroxymyristoyl] glucosamine N-acyltransferase